MKFVYEQKSTLEECQKQLEQKYKELHSTQQLKIKPRFQELEILCQKLEKDFNCLTEEQIQIQSLHGSLGNVVVFLTL